MIMFLLLVMSSQVYCQLDGNKRGLPVKKLKEILSNPVERLLSTRQPFNAQGGNLFVVDFRKTPEKKDDTRADGFRWRQDSM